MKKFEAMKNFVLLTAIAIAPEVIASSDCSSKKIQWSQNSSYCSAFALKAPEGRSFTTVVDKPTEKGGAEIVCEGSEWKVNNAWCGEGNKGNPQVVQYVKPNEVIDYYDMGEIVQQHNNIVMKMTTKRTDASLVDLEKPVVQLQTDTIPSTNPILEKMMEMREKNKQKPKF